MSSTGRWGKLVHLLEKPEYFFVMVAAIFGGLFILLVPPFQTPDENVHFYRAYEVSELGANKSVKDGAVGSLLPASIAKTEGSVNALPDVTTHIQFNPYNKYSLSYTKNALFNIPLNQQEKLFYRTETYPMIVYLPQASAIGIGKLFNAPVIMLLYMARLANLIIWIVICFFCIKYFPWKKWAVVGVCLLPVVVAQTISPGLDVLAISSTLAFMTIIFYAMSNKRGSLGAKQIALLGLAAVVMVFMKSTLAVFLPLVFLLKNDRLSVKYKKLVKIAIVILPIILFASWTIFSTSNNPNPVPASSQQVSTFLHNPFHYVHLLLNTGFFVTISGNAVVQSLVGNFGWLDTPLSPFITFLAVCYMAFLLFVNDPRDKSKREFSKKSRILMTLSAAALVLATFLAMYVYSTLPTDNHIKGVQGRYLVPFLLLLVPILMNIQIFSSKSIYTKVVKIGSVALLVLSLLTIFARYYYNFIPT